MEATVYEFQGTRYAIAFMPHLSKRDYTQKYVYHIKTEEDNFIRSKNAIHTIIAGYIMKDTPLDIWTEADHELRSKKEGMIAALHRYFTFKYDEKDDIYVYTYIIPYDD